MLGEAFIPQYRSISSMTGPSMYSPMSFAPGPTSRPDMVFDGYAYTHAIVIGFSRTGKLLWDNSFEINDVKSFSLEQFVKIQPATTHVNLLYLFHSTIRTKIIKDSEVLEGKTSEDIKTEFESDKVQKTDALSRLDYWYPGYFYACGIQLIRNSQLNGPPPARRVFYINKITNK